MKSLVAGGLPALVALLVVAACGGEKPDTYVYESRGARFTYTVPAPSDNELVQRVEEYRHKAGGAPVSYILAAMDNSDDLEERYFPDMAVATRENEGVVFLEARWVFDTRTEEADGAVYAEGKAVRAEFREMESAPVGGSAVVLLSSLEFVPSISRVVILASVADAMNEGQPPSLDLRKLDE